MASVTTTTRRPRVSPGRAIGVPNLRLYLIAFLASVYVLAWWTFGARASARAAEIPRIDPAPEPRARQQAATWYQDLPPSVRPAVQLPAGWSIAERSTASPAPRSVTVPVRASAARPGRIRTRSS